MAGSPQGGAGGPRTASPGPAQPQPQPQPQRTGVAELRRAGEQRIGGAGALHAGGRGRGHGLQVSGGGRVVRPTLLGRRRASILCCKTQADPEPALQSPGRRTRRGPGAHPAGPFPSRSTYESGGCCPGRACPGGGWEWRPATTWRCGGSRGGPTWGQGVGEKNDRGGRSATGRAPTGGSPAFAPLGSPAATPARRPHPPEQRLRPRRTPRQSQRRARSPGLSGQWRSASVTGAPNERGKGDAERRRKGGRR